MWFSLTPQIEALDVTSLIYALSKLEKAPGHRIKNNKRDACKLARYLREYTLMGKNKLHCVHVPEVEGEALHKRAFRITWWPLESPGTVHPPTWSLGLTGTIHPFCKQFPP